MGTLPSIPEYYKRFINPNVDLVTTKNVPCDLHGEQNGKSFSWSPSLNKWRCFGRCKCGGDVIDLHRKNRNFATREEAEESLRLIYKAPKTLVDLNQKPPQINEDAVRFKVAYNRAISKAKTVEDWLTLDYILSQYPPDIKQLEVFNNETV